MRLKQIKVAVMRNIIYERSLSSEILLRNLWTKYIERFTNSIRMNFHIIYVPVYKLCNEIGSRWCLGGNCKKKVPEQGFSAFE